MSRALGIALSFALSACEVGAVVEQYPAPGVDAAVTPDASPAVDAGSDAEAGYGCDVAFAQQGTWVTMTTTTSETVLPQGGGGDVVPGTYVLTALASYLGGPTGNVQVRATMQVIGSPASGVFETLSEVTSNTSAFPSHGPEGSSASYTEESTVMSFDLSDVCPGGTLGIDGYTATSTTLTLLDGQAQLAWTYTAK